MPAKSKQQQKFMGIVHAIQKGEMKPSEASKKAQAAAKEMKPGEVTKFAATKHKRLPKKVKKKKVKEGTEGMVDAVYAVQKPYSGCQLTSLVHQIDPLVGLGGSEIVPDQVHGVYQDPDQAQAAAQGLYQQFQEGERALEEKKAHVVEKIKKTMDGLEKQRKQHVEMIKENPKEADQHKEKVAHIATQIDDLVDKLQKIEKSKKELEDDTEKVKKALKEALSKKSKLSSKEYQEEKKKKDFKASDWEWDKEEQLYKIKKDLKEEKEYTLGVDKSRAHSQQYFVSDSKGNRKYFDTKEKAEQYLKDKKEK